MTVPEAGVLEPQSNVLFFLRTTIAPQAGVTGPEAPARRIPSVT